MRGREIDLCCSKVDDNLYYTSKIVLEISLFIQECYLLSVGSPPRLVSYAYHRNSSPIVGLYLR